MIEEVKVLILYRCIKLQEQQPFVYVCVGVSVFPSLFFCLHQFIIVGSFDPLPIWSQETS